MIISFQRALLVSSMAAAMGFVGAAGAQEITGAGASFPAPIYLCYISSNIVVNTF